MKDKNFETQADFASETGISFQTLSNYLSGKSQPKLDFLDRLTVNFGINGTWLLTGKGPMYQPEPQDEGPTMQRALGPVAERVDGIERSAKGTPLPDLLAFVVKNLRTWYDREVKQPANGLVREPNGVLYAHEPTPEKHPSKSEEDRERTRD